jgi:casein kinase II subunit beta
MGVEDMSEDLTTSSSDNDLDVEFDEFSSWGAWFCSMKGNEFFCEVDEDYIRDGFNLSGLSNQVPWYEYALDVLTDGSHSLKNEVLTAGEEAEVEASSEILYGLIHARYIITARGLNRMLEKYKSCDFGRCPRVMCSGQPCLPVGLSDVPRQSTVKLFCPHCEDVFYPRSKYQGHVDGAYFGTTFPHLFLMTFPQLRPEKRAEMYVPKVFGFKISPLAYSNNTKDTGGSGRHVRTRGGEEQESRGNKNAGSTSTSGMKKSKQHTG